MCLEGLTKFEKDRVLTEIPPVKTRREKSPKCKYSKKGKYLASTLRRPRLPLMSSWRNWTSLDLIALVVKYP